MMPALAGSARMPYPRFLAFNVAGGMLWGVGFALLGLVAGNSYEAVAKAAGRDIAVVVGVLALCGVIIWQVRLARQGDARRPRGSA
ncbi:DedA family protein [Arthrobacter sp. NPDC058130]|uniref:DedA family protein n=1 Tax=Arthrobacter sp. NPDC058130 TaxID=3346353 RepID=UPI0036E98B64